MRIRDVILLLFKQLINLFIRLFFPTLVVQFIIYRVPQYLDKKTVLVH
jgi:hypothetical protein